MGPYQVSVCHYFLHFSTRMANSFAIGFSLNVLLYALLLLLHMQMYVAYFVYGEAIIVLVSSILLSINKQSVFSYTSNNNTDILKLSLLLFLMLLLEFVLYQMPQRSALFNGYQNYFQDMLYWQKACIASSKGYPLPELSISGYTYNWHVFSCFFIALMHCCTGIEFYDLCFCLSYLWDMFLLLGAIYVFFNETLQNKKLIYIGCVILLFVSGFEKQFGCYYLAHLYQCKLGVTEGFATSLLSFVFISKAISQNKIISKEFLLSILFFAVSCGAKIPYACILIIGIGFLLVFSLKKTNWISSILVLFCFLGVFLLIAKLFVFSNAVSSGSSNSKLFLSAYGSILGIPQIHRLFLFLSNHIGSFLSWGLVTALSIMCINYVVLGSFLFSTIITIYKKQLHNLTLWALFLMVCSGLLLFTFINHSGRSQVYFLMASFPYAVLFSLYIFENNEFKLKRIALFTINILIIVSFISTIYFAPKVICNPGYYRYQDILYSTEGNDITKDELTALLWVRDNLPDNIILATNKVLAPHAQRSFVTSAFTERQIFIEGYEYSIIAYSKIATDRVALLSAYYNGDIDAKNTLLNEGVTYAVLFKAFHSPNSILGDVLYENNAMIIYQLKQY